MGSCNGKAQQSSLAVTPRCQTAPSKKATTHTKVRHVDGAAHMKVTSPSDTIGGSVIKKGLADGAVKLLSAKWLLSQPADFKLARCQDLPKEAFIPPGEAREMFEDSHVLHMNILVLSYPWLSKAHPDPSGFHLQRVVQYLKAYMKFMKKCEVGIFWDFASLPQHPRSEEDNQIFQQGLQSINFLYGSQVTGVIQLKTMPSDDADSSLNLIPYDERGWCTVEAKVAGVMKNSVSLLDLSQADHLLKTGADWLKIRDAAMSSRPVPMLPLALAELLESKKFTAKADKTMVANLYADYFEQASASCETLFYSRCGGAPDAWGTASALEDLANFLSEFKLLKRLYLQYRGLDDEAIAMLAPALSSTPLQHLILGGNVFGAKGLLKLQDLLPKMSSLRLLQLPEGLQHTKEAQPFEKTWVRFGKQRNKIVWSDALVAESEVLEENLDRPAWASSRR